MGRKGPWRGAAFNRCQTHRMIGQKTRGVAPRLFSWRLPETSQRADLQIAVRVVDGRTAEQPSRYGTPAAVRGSRLVITRLGKANAVF